jgi:hypothetical protein
VVATLVALARRDDLTAAGNWASSRYSWLSGRELNARWELPTIHAPKKHARPGNMPDSSQVRRPMGHVNNKISTSEKCLPYQLDDREQNRSSSFAWVR